jgi:hypothetical protein
MTMPSNNPPLKDGLSAKGKVIYLDDAKKFDKKEKAAILVGASWCGYSQIGTGNFNAACNDMETGKCYLADMTDQKCAAAVKKLGLSPSAFPDHFIWDPATKKFGEMLGMRRAPELKKELSGKGFTF